MGYGINQQELLQIAMSDAHYVVQVDNFDALKDKLQMILDESCQGETFELRYMKQFLTLALKTL